jgi:hypothetical protein
MQYAGIQTCHIYLLEIQLRPVVLMSWLEWMVIQAKSCKMPLTKLEGVTNVEVFNILQVLKSINPFECQTDPKTKTP